MGLFGDRKKVIVEGYYCGDWLESFAASKRLRIPEGVTSIDIGGEILSLYSPENGFADSSGLSIKVKPFVTFSTRSLVTEDGRIYGSSRLQGDNKNVLDSFVGFVESKGFDDAYRDMAA